jgi:diguanylate cyclase (GGDEF)-like protein/PAS domain S-box-containing protein
MHAKSRAAWFLMAGIAFAVTAWGSLLLGRATGNVASIWLASAVVLAIALRLPSDALPLLLAGVVAGGVAIGLLYDQSVAFSTAAAACNALEIALVYLLLRRFHLTPDATMTRSSVLVFVLGCVLIVPAISGAFGALAIAHYRDALLRDVWLAWWKADAFGLFVGLPLAWTARRDVAWRLVAGRGASTFWPLAALTVLTVVLSLVWTSHPFVLTALPLLAVALWTGAFGTAVCSALLVASVLVTLMLHRQGVLPQTDGPLASAAIGDLWLYACMAAVGPLIVAFMTEQRAQDRARVEHAKSRLQTITDRLPARVAELGPDLRYRFVNAQYHTLHGLAPAQLIGRTPRDVFGDAIAARLRPHMERACQGHSERFEVELPDGAVLEAIYEPLEDTGGFLALSHDVTWRHEADRRLRILLESMPDAMLVVETDTRCIVLVNEAAERMFDTERGDLLGQPLGRFIGDFGALAMALNPGSSECGPATVDGLIDLVGRRENGDEFPIEALLRHLQLGDNAQSVLTLRDITARRQAEQALHRERERAQVTLNSISDAVITYCNRRIVTSLNPVAEDLLGWPRAEALGATVDDLIRLARQPDEAPLTWQADRAPGTPPIVHEATGLLDHRGGGQRRVTLSDAPLCDEAGHVVGGVIVVRDVSQAHTMAERMAYLAQHDHLTGLPNRAVLDERLAEVLARVDGGPDDACGALLFLDLDHFKRINDSLGHQAGDCVLRAVAKRLRNTVRGTDTVSRQGGDEFVVLLPQLQSRGHAATVAESIIRVIEAPISHEGHTLHVSASVGIAIFPEHGHHAETLTKYADSALYTAKRLGRGRFSYFDNAMSTRADQRLRLENELRTAIADGSLRVQYQPKIAMPTRTLCGTEVLVRWKHDDGRCVQPGEFVPVAEETGLITAIDEWVLRTACRQVRSWIDAGLPPLPVSVNVSLARLDPDRLLRTLRSALDESRLPPELLEVEFTESQMLGQHAHARRLVDSIRDLGVRLAVDDFGTGYSSLSYLTEYRFDTIKIDQAFVHGLPTGREPRAVARAILGMAESLECAVIAEGVESDAQADILVELGCTQMQGFLFAPPLPAAQIEARLQAHLH